MAAARFAAPGRRRSRSPRPTSRGRCGGRRRGRPRRPTQVYEYVGDVAAALAEARGAPCAPEAACSCSTPTGTRSSGGRPTTASWPGCWPPGTSTWPTATSAPAAPASARAGFALEEGRVVPLPPNVGYDPGSYSGMMIPLVAGFVPGRGGVTDDEAAAWADGLRGMGPDYFFALSRFMFLARRDAGAGAGDQGAPLGRDPIARRRGRGKGARERRIAPSRPPLRSPRAARRPGRREHPAKRSARRDTRREGHVEGLPGAQAAVASRSERAWPRQRGPGRRPASSRRAATSG